MVFLSTNYQKNDILEKNEIIYIQYIIYCFTFTLYLLYYNKMESTTRSVSDIHTICDIEKAQDVVNANTISVTRMVSNDVQIEIQDRSNEIIDGIVNESIRVDYEFDRLCKVVLFIICVIAVIISMSIIYS